ncbi:unnamed protein product [Blepharisma stoltei]|uniref:Uncharacterized protein n=1 Tax=Blepharisma stoltei TaxID=1481888 RepID=A0AAU9JJQ4_9CILI|nr:unnamed protein product [Blepharisma stoltei]
MQVAICQFYNHRLARSKNHPIWEAKMVAVWNRIIIIRFNQFFTIIKWMQPIKFPRNPIDQSLSSETSEYESRCWNWNHNAL